MKVETNHKIITPGRSTFRNLKATLRYKEWFKEELFRKTGQCDDCGIYLHVAQSGESYHKNDLATVDHILSLNRGGTNDFSNLHIICSKCNYVKGLSEQKNKTVKTYRKNPYLQPYR